MIYKMLHRKARLSNTNPIKKTDILFFNGSLGVDVVEWSRALDVRLSEWCCSVSMV
jgi:hypothetical protein